MTDNEKRASRQKCHGGGVIDQRPDSEGNGVKKDNEVGSMRLLVNSRSRDCAPGKMKSKSGLQVYQRHAMSWSSWKHRKLVVDFRAPVNESL